MAQLKYATPFAFLALVPLGASLGGAWTFLAAFATPLCLVAFDEMFGAEDGPVPELTRSARWLPRLYVILQIAVTIWVGIWVTRPSVTLIEVAGLTLSTGLVVGVFGFVAAHEMIHSRDPRERSLGLALLASVFYMHFRIAHVYGHHRRAATADDPATARLGEGLYGFLLRSVSGQFREAWTFEAQRRQRAGRAVIAWGNRMIGYLAIETALLVAVGVASGRAFLFLVASAALAVALLESFNYIAHYGLSRRTGADGRLEPLGPQHSWNSGRRMNNAALFNMGRHSDHHRRVTRSYERLEPVGGVSELPSGYAAALLMALVPPLWHRVMIRRAETAMATKLVA